MDNEKELKRAELSDDEIDAVSGGYFTSDEERLNAFLAVQSSGYVGALAKFKQMDSDQFNSYTAEDIKKLL